MNKAQEIAIERIKREFCETYMYGDNYEIKKEKIYDEGGVVFYTIEVGMKNDEGTYASIFARDSIFVKVGERGGLYDARQNYKCVKHPYEMKKSI